MSKYIPVFFIVSVLQISCATNPRSPAVAHSINTLFGIQMGQPLKSQFAECPKNAQGQYNVGFTKGAIPCWRKSTGNYAEVNLPESVLMETKALLDSTARVTLENNNVVEIEMFAEQNSWQALERYMMDYYGKPLEIETYERDSRVSGLSESRILTWRSDGVSLHFTERASNDKVRIRVISDAWAIRESQRNKAK